MKEDEEEEDETKDGNLSLFTHRLQCFHLQTSKRGWMGSCHGQVSRRCFGEEGSPACVHCQQSLDGGLSFAGNDFGNFLPRGYTLAYFGFWGMHRERGGAGYDNRKTKMTGGSGSGGTPEVGCGMWCGGWLMRWSVVTVGDGWLGLAWGSGAELLEASHHSVPSTFGGSQQLNQRQTNAHHHLSQDSAG
jgi:hypothetical protein